ncbi:MAG: GNAT family N-acetyltransferase [Thermoplasmata archaeon]|nr:GNAT family N-acetyltransferase [Thermoplasmata archaeon]
MTAPVWRPLQEDPEGASRLLEVAEAAARATGSNMEAEGLAAQRKGVQERKRSGGLLRDPDGPVWGVAVWTSIEGLGRRVSPIYLAEDHQNPAGWTRFLASLLESPDPAGRVLLFSAPMPGFSDQEARAFLVPRGFHPYHRYGLKFPPGSPLPDAPALPLRTGRIRTVGPADLEGLAILNTASYARSIDRFLFATANEPLVGARRILQSLFEGEYGTFVGDASFGLELAGELRGATIVTRRPTHLLLADVEVHPSVQGQGHARRLIRATLEAVARDSTTPLVLAVTEESPKALRLYRDLGFVVQDGPFTFWADTAALGISPSPSSP